MFSGNLYWLPLLILVIYHRYPAVPFSAYHLGTSAGLLSIVHIPFGTAPTYLSLRYSLDSYYISALIALNCFL